MLLTVPKIDLCKELYFRGDYDFITVNPETGKKNAKQEQALQALHDDNVDEVYYGGAKGGAKSWLAVWQLMMCLKYPGVKGFFAREELKKIQESTLETFIKVSNTYGADNEWTYRGNPHNDIQFKNSSKIKLIDVGYKPSDPMYTRLGSIEHTFGHLDEAGEVTEAAKRNLKLTLGRHLNKEYGLKKKLLVTANPAKNWLYNNIYKKHKQGSLPDGKVFIPALATDNPFLSDDYIKSLQELTGVDRERLLLGNWDYDDSDDALIPYDAIEAVFKNTHVGRIRGGSYITADIAMQGSDRFVIGVWQGFKLVHMEIFKKISGKEIEEKIRALAYEYGVPEYRICFDGDGLGSYLKGYLELAQSFRNGATPVKANVEGSQSAYIKEEYANLKSQCYFRLAKMIKDGKIWIACNMSSETQEMLVEELEAIRDRSYGTDAKLEVLKKQEVKDLIGRSPDLTDMLMMRMYFTLHSRLSDSLDIDYYTGRLVA